MVIVVLPSSNGCMLIVDRRGGGILLWSIIYVHYKEERDGTYWAVK